MIFVRKNEFERTGEQSFIKRGSSLPDHASEDNYTLVEPWLTGTAHREIKGQPNIP